ncbi:MULTISPECIES: CHAP domain-containing protein [unclassified Acinetobacter]|uniref:CHAP domain-containing protein n=1 Tax=unclassified Acinetobacter TaxID=196816 RepID=UPI003A836693
MVYDQPMDMSAIHAPAQANIILRSKAEQNPKKPSTGSIHKAVSSSNGHRINIEKFTSYLQGITRRTSTQKCARSIRVGLQSSGAKIVNHPVAAADWGNTLMQLGYKKINASFDRPKKGDIYIIDRTSNHKYGHIAAYSGTAWVSDFKQNSHAIYRTKNLTYSYYRLETYF